MSSKRWLSLSVAMNLVLYGLIAAFALRTPTAQAMVAERPTTAHVKALDCSVFDPGDCETQANAWFEKSPGHITDRKVVVERGRLIIVIFYEVPVQQAQPPAPKQKVKKLPAEALPK